MMRQAHKGTSPLDWEGLEAFRETLPEYRRVENYRFLAARWDIVRALYLLKQRPRDPQPIDVTLFANNYGFPFIAGGAPDDQPPEHDSGFFSVDTETVMSDQVNLAR